MYFVNGRTDMDKRILVRLLFIGISVIFLVCPAYAENRTAPVYVDAREEDREISVGDVESQRFGVHVQAGNGHKAIVSAENVTAGSLENFNGAALYVSVNGSGSLADVKTKDLTAENESENYGANINAVNGGHAVINAGKISGWTGIEVNADGKNSSVSINTGDIHAVQYGLLFQSNDYAEIDISAGNIVSVMEGIFNPFYAMAGNGGKVRVTAKDVICEHEFGVSGFASGTDSKLTIKTNDIRTDYIGLSLSTENGAGVYAETGDVTIINTDTGPYSPAISRRSIGGNSRGDGSFLEFRINGSVYLSELGNSTAGNLNQMPSEGILASCSENGNTVIQIGKNIEVKAEKTHTDVCGIRAENAGGTITVSAKSDVSAEVFGESNTVYGLYINNSSNQPGVPEESGQPDPDKRDETSVSKTMKSKSGGSRTNISIQGDLNASAYGLYLASDPDITADVLVTGTISGKKAGILAADGITPENLSLTVWAVRLNADGNGAVKENGSPAEEIEAAVKYIIKTDPASRDKVILTDENGYPLESSHDYPVAKQGEMICIRPSARVTISAAYNNGKPLERDDQGRFYLTVPKGGGMMLSVEAGHVIDFYRILDDEGMLPATGFSSHFGPVLPMRPQGSVFRDTGLTLQIPVLNVTEPILAVTKTDEGYPVEGLGNAVGLLDGTALPGKGFSVLTGHNHLSTMEAGPFLFLRTLSENDLILAADAEGNLQKFRVSGNYLISPDGLAALADKLTDESLVLVTCEDEALSGGYLHRRVVLALPD